jgi:[lysine-biosynthesis-protein LysW]--L-2-aminoadipate ligase
VNDAETAESVIEHRQTLGDYHYHVYYAQEYVNKPQRRTSALLCPVIAPFAPLSATVSIGSPTPREGASPPGAPSRLDLNEICVKAAHAVGGGILAIDVWKTPNADSSSTRSNHTMELENSSAPTGVDIAAEVVGFALNFAKGMRS